VSWSEISRLELDNTIPVRPPIVNRKIKPNAHRSGVSKRAGVPCKDASQEKTLIPVGTAMTMVAEVK